jgi:RNA polymerase sigma factor (sigma-70 family)
MDMATNLTGKVIRHLRKAVLLQDGAGMTDGQLLGCFIDHRDEAAFAAIIKRHGPMVWGVCRRLLPHHDAEDAFQATFLVLVRKAASVLPRELVGNWLYGVAYQTALHSRRTTARRRTRERQVTQMPEPAVAEQDLWHDLQPLLDQELARLPDKYRVAIVLCDLEGKTRKEAAGQLGCPEGTLAGRLVRGRVLLAKRLARHGFAVSGGAVAAVLSQSAVSASVPPSLASSTIKAASVFAAGQAAAGVTSVKVAALTEGVLRTMLMTKLKIATAMVFVFVLVCGGSILASHAQERRNDSAATKVARDDNEKLKETLLELDKQMWDASTKGDTKVLSKLMAETYLSIWAIDDRTDKAAALETSKRYRYSDRTLRDIDVRWVSKDAAVLTYVASYKVSVDNEEPRALPERRVSTVWGKRDGRWVVVFAQAMSGGD